MCCHIMWKIHLKKSIQIKGKCQTQVFFFQKKKPLKPYAWYMDFNSQGHNWFVIKRMSMIRSCESDVKYIIICYLSRLWNFVGS